MPIDPFVANPPFDPELTAELSAAFERAWATIERSGSPLAAGGQTDAVRELLAKYIIAAAQSGERDQNRLAEAAVLRLAEHSQKHPTSDERDRSA